MIDELSRYIELVPLLFWASSVVLFIALWINLRSHAKVEGLKSALKQSRNDLKALTASSLGIGRRLQEIERRQRRLNEKPATTNRQPVDIYEPANQPYDHAIHLAQQGKEVQEIISICGVSQNEAELIKMMHRLDQAS